MKLHLNILTLLLLFGIPLYSQDISVTIRKEYIENYINSLIDARAITIGKINGGYDDFDPDFSFVAHSLKSLTFNTNGTLSMRIEGHLQFVMDWAPDVDESIDIVINYAPISYYLNEAGETIIRVSLNPEVDGNSINSVSGDVYNRILGTALLFNIINSEDVSVSSDMDIPANIKYFSSVDPEVLDPNLRLLEVLTDGIKFNFVLKEGPRFVKVANDVNGAINLGNIEYEENSVWKPYPSPKNFELNTGTTQKFGTMQDLISETNGTYKYKKWTDKNGRTISEISPKRIQTVIPNVDPTYLAKFDRANRVQLANTIDGILSGSLTVNGTPITNNYDQYEFFDPNISKVLTSTAPTGADYFVGWSDGNMNQTRSYVVNQDINLKANYKGHLRTGAPELGDPVNQRRLVTDGYYQLMVYESMGEIWATWKGESSNWRQEVRLSSGNGNAKNPSLSNVFAEYSTLRTVATWVEGNQIIVQPLEWGNNFESLLTSWDQTAGAPLRDYTTLSVAGLARTDSRPVVNLDWLGNGKYQIWYAFEENNTGITTGKIELTNNIGNYSFSTAQFKSFGFAGQSTVVSTHLADKYPVLINQPAAFGFAAKQAIYFLAGGYASGRRIAEYLPELDVTTVFPVNNSEYTFSSLSGGVNPTSASYTLVATAQRNLSGGVISYDTEVYQKASYYSVTSLPSLSKIYSNATNPVVMVQNTPYIGSPVYEVNFKQGTNWYKATGSSSLTLVGSNASGVFAKEQVGSGDRKTVYVKTNTSPATLTLYSGSGVLNKGETVLYADVRSVRTYRTLTGTTQTAILDFAGALVEPVDSLENGSSICAVKLISPDQNSVIVRQPDTLKTALAVDVVRNGVAIRSYSAGLWESLSVTSFEDVQDGDVLVFRLGFPIAASTGYEIYDFNGTSLTKPEETAKPATDLKVLETGVAVYPNPFNPATTIAVSLASPSLVKVSVYNILGQQVIDFGKADLGAGVHTFPFDGKSLASGTYFYRVEIGDKVKTGKLQLLK